MKLLGPESWNMHEILKHIPAYSFNKIAEKNAGYAGNVSFSMVEMLDKQYT